MVQFIDKVVFVTEEEYQGLSAIDHDTLYLVSYSDMTLSVCFRDCQVSNFESVESLTQDLRNDTFYILMNESGSPLSVYYKYLNDGKSYFAPISDFRVQSISQDTASGVVVEVDGSSLRVLSLDSAGNISNQDLKCMKDLSGLKTVECRILWEET